MTPVGAGRLKAIAVLVTGFALVGGAAIAETVRDGDLQITVLDRIAPYKLPRNEPAPISVHVAGHLDSTTGGIPPQLKRMEVEVNRRGLLQSKGLPACPIPRIKTASTTRALQACSQALIGSGRFWGHIVLADQPPYEAHGRLLIFNGRQGSRSLVLAHIFTSSPFPSSFVIPFTISHIRAGTYGTLLTAPFPQALGDWGYVDRIKLNLSRKYRYRGRELSYFNAACPAPRGADRAAFSVARTTFYFEDRKPLALTATKACGVRE